MILLRQIARDMSKCADEIPLIQDRVAKNKLKIVAVGTKLSDLCTERANKGTCEKHMESLNQILYQIFAKGKAFGAKSLTPWQVQKQ